MLTLQLHTTIVSDNSNAFGSISTYIVAVLVDLHKTEEWAFANHRAMNSTATVLDICN